MSFLRPGSRKAKVWDNRVKKRVDPSNIPGSYIEKGKVFICKCFFFNENIIGLLVSYM